MAMVVVLAAASATAMDEPFMLLHSLEESESEMEEESLVLTSRRAKAPS